jgi:hypothetical protein
MEGKHLSRYILIRQSFNMLYIQESMHNMSRSWRPGMCGRVQDQWQPLQVPNLLRT